MKAHSQLGIVFFRILGDHLVVDNVPHEVGLRNGSAARAILRRTGIRLNVEQVSLVLLGVVDVGVDSHASLKLFT